MEKVVSIILIIGIILFAAIIANKKREDMSFLGYIPHFVLWPLLIIPVFMEMVDGYNKHKD